MNLRFTTPDAPELSPTELALYGKLDAVRMMVNASIRRFVNEHRELLHGAVLDYGAGKPGTCRTPQPFRYLMAADPYIPWEPGDTPILGQERYKFDAVLCTQVIQSVPDVPLLFRQFFEVLRPGGHLVVTYPVAWPEIEHELWRFTKHGVWSLCHQANLQEVHHRQLCEVGLGEAGGFGLVNGLVARKA